MGGQANFGMGIMMNVRDLASGPIGLIARNFTNLITAVASGSPLIIAGIVAITAALTSLAVGLGALRAAWDLAIDAGEFRRNMTAVAGISRATAEEMQLLERSAIDAGIATQFSPAEATEGLQSLAAAGQNAVNATQTLIPVLDLAAGSLGQLGVQGAAEAVVGTLNSFHLAADQATSVTDRLLRITQLTNFQARDFQQGLSRAAAAAGQFGTSIDDTLISIGLMRNMNIEASVASTAFREAQVRLMTDQRALSLLQREGVSAYDEQTGAARSALDITMDLADALRDETEAQRNQTVEAIFGRRGLNMFAGVMSSTREVMRDGARVTLSGRDAIRSYREEVGNAAGTAAEFRDMFLATFPGQMALIQGTLETLGIVFGDVFGEVFRPLVVGVTDALNMLIRAWTSFPRSLQVAMATIFLAASALMTIHGAGTLIVIAVVAAIAILGKLLVVMFAVGVGITIALAPVIAGFTVLAGIAVLLHRAYRDNLGGLADFINGWVARVRLVWEGLVQMFTDGFLSGEVQDELMRTQNRGLLVFIGDLVDFAARAQALWRGVVKGFEDAWQELGPVFKVLIDSMQVLFEATGRAFGEDAGGLTDAANKLPTQQFNDAGQSIGGTLVEGITLAIQALTLFIEVLTVVMDIYAAFDGFIQRNLDLWGGVADILSFVAGLFESTFELVSQFNQGIVDAVPGLSAVMDLLGARETNVTSGSALDFDARRAAVGGRASAVSRQGAQGRINAAKAREHQRIQSGTERPAAVEPGGGGGDAVEAIEGVRRAIDNQTKGRKQVANLNSELRLDGDLMARSITRIQERNGLLEGETVQTE